MLHSVVMEIGLLHYNTQTVLLPWQGTHLAECSSYSVNYVAL